MIEIKGQHNTAICYTHILEPGAEDQIRTVCDMEQFADSKIRIMPDVHAGKGCVIGTTMTITDKIVPGMVGVDIGCGMETVLLGKKKIDYAALDSFIRKEIPSGRGIRKTQHPMNADVDLDNLRIPSHKVGIDRARKSIGTLGGGNHFIEIGRCDEGNLYLIVHSGSRHIGGQVADYYQDKAYASLVGNSQEQIDYTIKTLKEEGRHAEIEGIVNELKALTNSNLPKALTYVSGALFDNYIHDMKIIQQYAVINRKAMTEVILSGMGIKELDRFTTTHNYVDTDTMILRKGAVSAKAGERLLIPINMRDGSLICVGKGNADWNCSAPHGAGRLMSRTAAFKALSLNDFEKEMSGIFTTSVGRKTLDEAPMAYKNMDDIVRHITPTADILMRIRPTYNFKAAE